MWNTVQNSFVILKNITSTIVRTMLLLRSIYCLARALKSYVFFIVAKLLSEAKILIVVKELSGSTRGFCHFSYLDHIPSFSKPLYSSRTRKRERALYVFAAKLWSSQLLWHTEVEFMLLCTTLSVSLINALLHQEITELGWKRPLASWVHP